MPSDLRAIVGLGNPGEQYAGTRHNFGFMVIKALIKRHGIAHKKGSPLALVNRWEHPGGPVLLVRPRTYMNLSGEAVRWLVDSRQIGSERLLVLVDDLALPLGRLRIRPRGGAGGHNGLANIIAELGSSDYPRLRLGIGSAAEGQDTRDYVLEPFTPQEKPVVEATIQTACDCVESWLSDGLEACMNRFNANPDSES